MATCVDNAYTYTLPRLAKTNGDFLVSFSSLDQPLAEWKGDLPRLY